MDVGAGDQGIMFGYASDETEDCMPLTHSMATRLGKTLTDVRKSGECWWLRPDGKTQVTIEYQHPQGRVRLPSWCPCHLPGTPGAKVSGDRSVLPLWPCSTHQERPQVLRVGERQGHEEVRHHDR